VPALLRLARAPPLRAQRRLPDPASPSSTSAAGRLRCPSTKARTEATSSSRPTISLGIVAPALHRDRGEIGAQARACTVRPR
jgi:hypothetical protein